MKSNNLKSLDQFIEEEYGKEGTPKRDKFEKGYQEYKAHIKEGLLDLENGRVKEVKKEDLRNFLGL